MPSAFILAPISSNLPSLPSEAQEVVNVLSAASWQVHLNQDEATLLELWRMFDAGQYDLGWIGAHSGAEGWALTKGILRPTVLGNLLNSGGTTDLVLNSCFSAEHVEAIQENARLTNIVATIRPGGIEDQEAWSAALYLVRQFVRTGSLRAAARQAGRQYRWFAAREVPGVDEGMDDKAVDARLRRTEETVDKLVRALQGEQFSSQPGLIAILAKHQQKMEEYIEHNEEWKEHIETQFTERQNMTLTPRAALQTLVAIAIAIALVILLTRLGSIAGGIMP